MGKFQIFFALELQLPSNTCNALGCIGFENNRSLSFHWKNSWLNSSKYFFAFLIFISHVVFPIWGHIFHTFLYKFKSFRQSLQRWKKQKSFLINGTVFCFRLLLIHKLTGIKCNLSVLSDFITHIHVISLIFIIFSIESHYKSCSIKRSLAAKLWLAIKSLIIVRFGWSLARFSCLNKIFPNMNKKQQFKKGIFDFQFQGHLQGHPKVKCDELISRSLFVYFDDILVLSP